MHSDPEKTPRAGSPQDYESLVQHSGELLGVVDFYGRLEARNRAWETTLGLPAETELPNFFAAIHPDDRERMLDAVLRAGRGEEAPPFEVRCRDREGAERRISWRLTASAGRQRCLVSGREVAPAAEIAQASPGDRRLTELGLLAALVAHDFNNVLTIIRGCASMLEILPGLTPAQRIELDDLTGGVRHGTELARQVVDYSRNRTPEVGDLDLNKVVARMGWMLRRLGRENIGVDLDLGRDLGLVKAQEVQVEQVLFNLALNACDAMSEGGRLSIVTEEVRPDAACVPPLPSVPNGYVRLGVSDTGGGIPPEIQARLFEPFFTTKRNGTGLGLFSVQRIVQQCGGQLRIRSVPGQGTNIDAYFPRAASPRAGVPL